MINDRQFYISKESSPKLTGWQSIVLGNGCYIHYQPKLSVPYQSRNIVLLGYAWQVDPSRKSPQEELARLDTQGHISHDEVFHIENTWCGRYVLIVKDWLYLDASGCLGIFYDTELATSSLNVLCQVEGRPVVYPNIEHQKMPDFIPGMKTPYTDVKRLMPSQILNIATGGTAMRPLLVDPFPTALSTDEIIRQFSEYYIHSIHNLAKVFASRTIWLALTGGRDSRTTMAFFEKAGIEYNCFTLWHSHIRPTDIRLPKKLAKTARRPYRFIKREARNYSAQRYADYRTHTAGMAVDEDWQFYAHGQYQSLCDNGKEAVIIRNSVWGIAINFYEGHLGPASGDVKKIFPRIPQDEFLLSAATEWEDMVKHDTANPGISYPDRAFWELREGSWLSSLEQSFDMMDGITSIQPANCRLFLSILMGFDKEIRVKKQHEELMTTLHFPPFGKVPYDYQCGDSLWTKWQKKAQNLARRFKRAVARRIKG